MSFEINFEGMQCRNASLVILAEYLVMHKVHTDFGCPSLNICVVCLLCYKSHGEYRGK
jgi:hypothetical protein